MFSSSMLGSISFGAGAIGIHPSVVLHNKSSRAASLCMAFGSWKDGRNGVIWEAEEIAEVIDGALKKPGFPGSISTDARTLQAGDWFLALVGNNFDGNKFLHQALEAGCAGAIGHSIPKNWPVGFVEVPDTLKALHKLASSVRERYSGSVVGITGSCGKTTTKALTALALESLGIVHQTQGNFNNHVGLPLTLLKLPSHSPACVLEMGMNHSGEILQLSNICRPSVRVILNVGPVHLENFNRVEDIAAAKGELLRNAGAGDTCVLNADDPLVMALPVPGESSVKLFGCSETSHVRLSGAKTIENGRGIRFTLERDGFEVESTLEAPGLHLATNACAAACVATTLDIDLSTAAASISKYSPVAMRSAIEDINSELQVINDSYNANPMSMRASLELLASFPCRGRRIVALGDMLELGSLTKAAHLEALKLCQRLHVDIIGTAGPEFSQALEGIDRDSCGGDFEAFNCEDSAALAAQLPSKLMPGDVVLVKGSRRMKMELVVDAIRSKFLQRVW